MTIRQAILTSIESHQGLKGVDLALNVMGLVNPVLFEYETFDKELRRLIKEKRIVEIKYCLPLERNEVLPPKSIFFPKGTRLEVEGTNGNGNGRDGNKVHNGISDPIRRVS